ncbi:uncharacterized protein GIQ15_04609 [Arthroderma uncinatum]|uniref:uncharacterized protein n=1 Tax=Arthroderma uncinatum TaxID=74035 RepID=UPI00144AB876|nr:uncharacterized protein GIQ15_04609 [Arthroderma uncinatum]KAF3481850.1 hypothetical protein GIQ15_04609 [Arthroderma uncinatum]
MLATGYRALRLASSSSGAEITGTRGSLGITPYSRRLPALASYSTTSEAPKPSDSDNSSAQERNSTQSTPSETSKPAGDPNAPNVKPDIGSPKGNGSAAAPGKINPSTNTVSGEEQKPNAVPGRAHIRRFNSNYTGPHMPHMSRRLARTQPLTSGIIRRVVQGAMEEPKAAKNQPRMKKGKAKIPIKVDDETFYFEPSFLRESCDCARCIHPSTRQRTFEAAQIPIGIGAKDVEVDSSSVKIKWQDDIPGFEDHISTFKNSYLADLAKADVPDSDLSPPSLWDKKAFEKSNRWVTFEDYMQDGATFSDAMMQLKNFGLLFLRNVPEDTESVAKIATRLGPIKNTFYGPTWDVKNIPDPKNVAYTNDALGFHMDLLYLNEPPGYQFLHCMKNELPGGESLFADSFHAANILRQTHNNHFTLLNERRVGFGYKNDNQDYISRRRTIEISGAYGKKSVVRVNYSPPFQVATTNNHRAGLKVDQSHNHIVQSLKVFKSILERKSNVVKLKLNAGECVIFQNQRVVHGREAFASAEGSEGRDRWLRGTYVDDDAVRSKFKSLGL